MTAKEMSKKININARHYLYRKNGIWYHHLKEFPGVLFDENGYIVFNTKVEYLNNQSLKHKQTLHVRGGISSIKGYTTFTKEEKKLLGISSNINGVDEKTIRQIREVSRIKRNQKLVDNIKRIYEYSCQICGEQLQIRIDLYYSEVHHIKPLGFKHNGPDILENMICVCPNHHALLDLGAIKIDFVSLSIKHNIRKEFIDYHNKKIFNSTILFDPVSTSEGVPSL